MKTTNQKCRDLVVRCEPFTGSHLSGIKISDKLYVVYSYGWWPIWAKIRNKWYGHYQKYSSTTSCHTSQSRPDCPIKMLADVDKLKSKIQTAR